MSGLVRFSQKESVSAFEFVAACNSAASKDDFLFSVYPKLLKILPHEMFACARGDVDRAHLNQSINVSFPEKYVRRMSTTYGSLGGPLIQDWLKSQSPVYHDKTTILSDRVDPSWRAAFHDYGLHNMVNHGFLDASKKALSYFWFAWIEPWDTHQAFMINMLVPHLHIPLTRIFGCTSHIASVGLSSREKEMLNWICTGKSNPEIAEIIGISPWTVKIHVRNLMAKLDVSSRSQAVAKAFELGLLQN